MLSTIDHQNNTTSHLYRSPHRFPWQLVIIEALLGAIIIVTISGNLLVCVTIATYRKLHAPTYCFIMCLAATDLMLGLIVLPLSAYQAALVDWPLGSVLCNVYVSCDVFFCTISILTLFAISVDRYIAITRPLHYHRYIRRKIVWLINLFIWLFSLLIAFFPIFLGWNTSDGHVQNYLQPEICNFEVNAAYSMLIGVGTYFCPLIVMCLIYAKILLISRRQAKAMNQLNITQDKRNSRSIGGDMSVVDHDAHSGTTRQKSVTDVQQKFSRQTGCAGNENHSCLGKTEKNNADIEDKDKNKKNVKEQSSETLLLRIGETALDNIGANYQDKAIVTNINDTDYKSIINQFNDPINDVNEANKRCILAEEEEFNILDVSDEQEEADNYKSSYLRSNGTNISDVRLKCRHADSSQIKKLGDRNVRPAMCIDEVTEVRDSCVSVSGNLNTHPTSKISEIPEKLDFKGSPKRDKKSPLKLIKKLAKVKGLPSSQHKLASEHKATMTVGSIIVAFGVCWIPYFIVFLAKPYLTDPVNVHVELVVLWLGYVNSAINPFLYAFYSSTFRKGFVSVLFRRKYY